MAKKKLLKQIKKDFSNIVEKKKITGILLYGSYTDNKATNRSDIDICVVAPDEDMHNLLSYILQNINVNLRKYDVRIFSELPLYIKINVIEDGILIYSPNELDLYEYFYTFRKLWADQKHRQTISKDELLSLL